MILLASLQLSDTAYSYESGEITVDNDGTREKVLYQYYMPVMETPGPLPLIIGIGGLDSTGEQFMVPKWTGFADNNGFAILSLGFSFRESDWQTKRSYQYPSAWSGRALIDILKILSDTTDIDTNELYIFGVSAGAQFAHRFALLYPDICVAVAAHAAGGYDSPARKIGTGFLITVGELDNKDISRLEFARLFVSQCRKYGIDARLRIIPGLGHNHIELQDEMSQAFFLKTRSGKR